MTTSEMPAVASPAFPSFSQSSRSRSSARVIDDVTSLTSFNPFSEEDEHDQSSYTLVTSLFSRMKNTLSAPLSSAVAVATSPNPNTSPGPPPLTGLSDQRRPSYAAQTSSSNLSAKTSERPISMTTAPAQVAPPLVSLTPAQSELPTYSVDYERSPSRGAFYSPVQESGEGVPFGYSIPGFPIQDDARSIKTSVSFHRSGSVSKIMRRIRGEGAGLSREYWMDDETCKECYYCKSIFTTWRRKHHCRICGQIFCSRCASNIIKGLRFGHDGMIRVCNLCLEKLTKVDEDDEDDRRSVNSSVTSFPAHQQGIDVAGGLPQSPFAASQLFGRTDEPFNLYSIAETKRVASGSDRDDFGSRPMSPRLMERDDGVWEPVQDNPAPFRRALSDEEKDPDNSFPADSPTAPGSKTPVDFPVPIPIKGEGMPSSIQFPVGSPDVGPDSPHSLNKLRGRFNSHSDFDPSTPFIRSRVHSRLDSLSFGEPGWRTRRESTAYAHELNLASMIHLKIMLRQMLTTEEIPNVKEWEETLLKLALRIAREMTFTSLPHRQGEDMDVRRYVKIKKVPGGAPRDSEYVEGAVITKNVAHKQMLRFQRNPRVMLVTFPLEFHRVEGQYIHFGQLVRQEKEYLGNLASRIAALRPHVVLVEQSVSRLALDALAAHNIAVARTVKTSAIQTVSRMTQGDVISSIDKLALEPRLGHCARFRIQSYDHPLIPGRRKTYMRFEGCNRDMGCTIILRGGDIDTLRRIKKVTRFLTFIVRNLKLETHLWKDLVITLPPFNPDAIPSTLATRYNVRQQLPVSFVLPSLMSISRTPTNEVYDPPSHVTITEVDDAEDDNVPDDDARQRQLTRRIDHSLEAYVKTFISVSATLRFLPPYPIRKMKELDNELIRAKQAWEDEVIRREEGFPVKHTQETTVSAAVLLDMTALGAVPSVAFANPDNGASELADLNAQIEALPSVAPGTPVIGDYRDEDRLSYFSQLSGSSTSFTSSPESSMTGSSRIEVQPEPKKTTEDIALESRYSLFKWMHEEQRRVWEWYLRKNQDDFVAEKYQCIRLWEYTTPTDEFNQHQPCFVPHFKHVTFYGENDCTLGQFIERAVQDTLAQFLDPRAICSGKGCDKPLARHCKVFVHNEARLFIAVEQWDGQIIGRENFHPAPDLITTWSACRVCGSATPFIPVSEEMQRYSFAKFLELHFYPADVKLVQGAGCQHNIYQHHIRYFASKGMTVRFQTDPVTMHDIVYPPFRIRIRPETQLELKNAEYHSLHSCNFRWYTALIGDLKLISIEAATGDEEHDARLLQDINALITRAESERDDICRLINRIYRESAPTDTLALNQVHAYRQDKIVAWQQDFDRLPKPRSAKETVEHKRSSAFGSVRAIWPRRYDFFEPPHVPSPSVSEAEQGSLKKRRGTGGSLTSSASEASESEIQDEKSPAKEENESPEIPLELEVQQTVQEIVQGAFQEQPNEDLVQPDVKDLNDFRLSTINKSEEESDSTARENPIPAAHDSTVLEDEVPVQRISRLPRRPTQRPSVAELVKKYQDIPPPQGMHVHSRTIFPPPTPFSESEQEYPYPIPRRPQTVRNKSRHRVLSRKASISDFEQSYAANVAPKYLTHSRRTLTGQRKTRIPGPPVPFQESSRPPSPEKRPSGYRGKDGRFSRPASPTNFRQESKSSRQRPSTRSKDKTQPLRANPPSKSAHRKPPTISGGRVSSMTKHWERLGREAERSKSRYAVIRGKRVRPVASSKATVEILESVKDVIEDESEPSDSSSEADDEDEGMEDEKPVPQLPQPLPDPNLIPTGLPVLPLPAPSNDVPLDVPSQTLEAGLGVEAVATMPSLPMSPATTDITKDAVALLTSDGEPGSSQPLPIIPGLLPQPSRISLDDDPMNDPEHIFRDSSMVVRTDEPTSLIALALNSPQYKEMLVKARVEKRTTREARLNDSGEAFMPDDRSDSASTWGVVNFEPADLTDPTEDMKHPSSKLPWAISFESSGLTISCTVLYPEQFDALRRIYDCDKSMIESLSRCITWNASGGKSGSAFLKTRDDRFIAKELSRPELQTMETFAPAYFDYMASSVSANRPTLLAKVFGCFKLTYKKTWKDKGPGRSKSTQMNLLVMENIFYDRRFTKIYDLKGSTRNRHVQSTGRENEVLLDENLVETAHLNPFYLREHSKRILRGALFNDTRFLADINVMDYSLICGVDSQQNELVVGIVDYIRTYTWDKKVESWVKESAFLGGRGEPTIVTPKQYRQRFISAMERYFPLIPDRWMKQKDTHEANPKYLLELWPDW